MSKVRALCGRGFCSQACLLGILDQDAWKKETRRKNLDQRKNLKQRESVVAHLKVAAHTCTYAHRCTHACLHVNSQSGPLMMLRPFLQVFLGISKGYLYLCPGSELQFTLILNSATPISAAVAPAGFACSAWISAPHETQTPAAPSCSLTLSAPIILPANPMARGRKILRLLCCT